MKTLRSLTLATALSLFALPAMADPTVSVSGPVTTSVATATKLAEVGKTLFKTQEAVHATVTATTGVAVPHDYIHVVVGGADVPVDPMRVGG